MTVSALALNRTLVGAALDRLARLNREAEARFRHTADRAGVDALRELLGRWARERARFAHELEIEAQALGERPNWTNGSPSRVRPMHEEGDRARVDGCRVSDQAGLLGYEEVLSMALPVEVERLLRSQYASIKDACARMVQIANGVP
jgi:hypothetical protein